MNYLQVNYAICFIFRIPPLTKLNGEPMKNLLIIVCISLMSFNLLANDLMTTKLKGKKGPNKAEIFKAIKILGVALKTSSPNGEKKFLEKARKLISEKSQMVSYKAAIVAEKNGKKVNLADYEDFLESSDGLCYNGNIKLALEVANKLNDNESIWIYDEYTLDSIDISGNSIIFKVMDEFSYSDQDASEEDREDFMTTYVAPKC